MAGHVGNARRPPGAGLQPVLHLQDRLIAMRQPRGEAAIMALFTPRRVDQQELSGLDHHRRPEQPVDDAQAKIGPRHQPSSRDDIAILDDDLVYFQPDVWKTVAEPLGKQPVGGGRAAGQKTRCGDDEGTAATGGQCCPLCMPIQQPAGVRLRFLDFGRPGQPAGYDENVGMSRPTGLGIVTARKFTALAHAPVADTQFRPAAIL